MTTRRNFFKTVGALLAGVALPKLPVPPVAAVVEPVTTAVAESTAIVTGLFDTFDTSYVRTLTASTHFTSGMFSAVDWKWHGQDIEVTDLPFDLPRQYNWDAAYDDDWPITTVGRFPRYAL